jgi:polysaccharide deacetylase family protein (PEP-CTERM system associated)
MKNILSIDVEDWFNILEVKSAPDLREWDVMESRVETNFLKILDLLDRRNIKATCFFLGWIGEKHPLLVREAARRKHEIASHGYSHQLIYTQTEEAFFRDVHVAKDILENISGTEVVGYRAPGFSIVPQTSWAFARLSEAGYKYDSSLFPAHRGHGFFLTSKLYPFKIKELDFFEFPISVASFLRLHVCFFGGGYLRLFPAWLIERMSRQVAGEDRPVIFYVHPREIDPGQPRLHMSPLRRFKSYINLRSTKSKLLKIIGKGAFIPFSTFIQEYKSYFQDPSRIVCLNSLNVREV